MTTLTGAGTYKRQRYLSTGKTALKTIEEKGKASKTEKAMRKAPDISDTIGLGLCPSVRDLVET